jgi:hypothetical protein
MPLIVSVTKLKRVELVMFYKIICIIENPVNKTKSRLFHSEVSLIVFKR